MSGSKKKGKKLNPCPAGRGPCREGERKIKCRGSGCPNKIKVVTGNKDNHSLREIICPACGTTNFFRLNEEGKLKVVIPKP